ncbi:MAG: outer membrane lipoprotein-sorting protein [Bacteroidales bacterium]
MKRTPVFLCFAALLTVCSLHAPGQGQDPDPKAIMQRSQDKINGKSSKGIMKMTIVRPGWSREVTMKTWSLEEDYYMIYILSPAREKGQVFLKRGNNMWNYLPSINRTMKIPSSMMSQSWMGSDFTNNDLMKMNSFVEDYDHSIVGEDTVSGYHCHILELLPKPSAPVVWGKVHVWVSVNGYYQMKFEFFDENMELVNREVCSNIKTMGDRKLPSKMVMTPADKEGNQTIIEVLEMEYNVDLSQEFFSRQKMKSVR